METHIPGYVEYRSNRKHRTGGGTSIYVWDKYTVLRSEKFSNGVCECQMIKIKELNLTVVNFYRPPGSDINSFQEALDKVSLWLEDDKAELVVLGDFNLPEAGQWSEAETLKLRETAAKREEGSQGIKTKQAMLLLEFSENFSLTQRVTEYTRQNNTLDLCWTNSSCTRACYTIQNATLSDHNYVAINYAITLLDEETKEIKNHFTTQIQNYNLEKLDEEGWKNLNLSLAKQDWNGITNMTPTEIQDKIVKNLEQAVKETAELKKKAGSKTKIPYIVKKFLGAKKKANRMLKRRKGLSTAQIKKLMEKIYRAEQGIQNYYKEKQDNSEKEAWVRMTENPKYFYSYVKKKATYKSPVGPLVNEKNEVIKEKTCITLNNQYASVFTKPDPKNALPEGYIDSDEDSPEEEKIIEDIY